MKKILRIFENLFFIRGDIDRRVVKSTYLLSIFRIFSQLLTFVRTIVLARILAPADFGVVEVAVLVMTTLVFFTQTGLEEALIQKKDISRKYLDTIFTTMLLRGAILTGMLYFSAPLISGFFNMTKLTNVIRMISIVTFIEGCNNVGTIYFRRELEFHKEWVYNFIGLISDLIVALFFVLLYRNIWALVFGFIAGALARLAASYLLSPYRPRLTLNIGALKELFVYSRWIIGSAILVFLISKLQTVFLAKMMGAEVLGLYIIALRFSTIIFKEIFGVINQVAFPYYSRLQNVKLEIKPAYLRILQAVSFLSYPLRGGLFILAGELTNLCLGEKWSAIVPVIRVLALTGFIGSIGGTTVPVMQGIGKPKILTAFQFLWLIISIGLICPMIKMWGLLGAVWSLVLGGLLTDPILIIITLNTLDISFKEFFRTMDIPIFCTILMIAAITFLKKICHLSDSIPDVMFLIFSGFMTYLISVYITAKIAKRDVFYFIKKSLQVWKEGLNWENVKID